MPSLPATAKPDTPVLLGIPFDANSSWLRGAAGAPPIIRVSFRSDSSNSWTETGVDLGAEGAYCDAGDLKFTFQEPFAAIEKKVGELLDKGLRVISLGGDHSIALPILCAYGKRMPGLTVIQFDAHPDLYDELEGNRLSHACPFARVMEDGWAKRLIQVGIRTLNGHQREQVKKFGVEVIEMRHLPALDRMKIDGPVYISFDMDALDPAFAPGISHREPGGMSVRDALMHIQAITGKIVGADIVEYNPAQDHTQITAMVAAKLLKEIMGKMIGG
ncbi:MAG: agmatinase [Acidobacteria bacterium]|nr:agmatinase [Acidobacteriota bacterium]